MPGIETPEDKIVRLMREAVPSQTTPTTDPFAHLKNGLTVSGNGNFLALGDLNMQLSPPPTERTFKAPAWGGSVLFDSGTLTNIGVSPDRCIALECSGDSMSPTIQNAAVILIDSAQTTLETGGIFAIRVRRSTIVRRVHIRADGAVDLISDNSTYPRETLFNGAVKDLDVIGKVCASVSRH